MRRSLRILAGALLLSGAAIWSGRLLMEGQGADGGTLPRLLRFLAERESRFVVVLPGPMILRVGDVVEVDGKTAGEVEALLDDSGRVSPEIFAWTQKISIRIHDRDRTVLHTGARARLVQVPEAAAWVIKTLLTEETIPKIAFEWNQTMLEHREEIFALLTPVVRDLIIDVQGHIEAELPAFLKRHEAEMSLLGDELKQGRPAERLTQLFETEVWPIAQPKLNPIIAKISDEIWNKVPVWGFTWRLAYQTLPGTDNDHVQKAWLSFLNGEAMTILRSHTDEIIATSKEIATEALTRDQVHSTFRELFGMLVAHPRFHVLAQAFLREVMLDNPSFHEKLWARARSPDVARTLEAASRHIEPMARRMGDILLGTREAGITTEFSKVLRSQILLKDRERIVLDPGPETGPPLAEGASIPALVEVEHAR